MVRGDPGLAVRAGIVRLWWSGEVWYPWWVCVINECDGSCTMAYTCAQRNRSMKYPIAIFSLSLLAAITAAQAQPHGWPCDYGYRPGNTWFYRSTSFGGDIYSERIVRDSIGDNGEYWVYFESPALHFNCWYRIDSSCIFDLFYNPKWSQYQHWFVATADSGDWWVVDTVSTQTPLHARVDNVYYPIVFGKSVTSKDIVLAIIDLTHMIGKVVYSLPDSLESSIASRHLHAVEALGLSM